MKNLISILFIIAINQSIAFSDSTFINKRQFGFRSGFYLTSYAYGISYFGYLTLNKGKHEFSIGPSFSKRPNLYGSSITINTTNKTRLNGLDVSYRVYPNGQGKIFDFYFQFDYLQKWAKASGYRTLTNYPELGDNTIDFVKVKSTNTQLLFEYGFDVKFLKHFYLGTALGIGYRFENRRFIQKTFTEYNYQKKDSDLDIIFRANVGFRL